MSLEVEDPVSGVRIEPEDVCGTLDKDLGRALLQLAARQWCDSTARLLRMYVAEAARCGEHEWLKVGEG